jgi:hypothetical protein
MSHINYPLADERTTDFQGQVFEKYFKISGNEHTSTSVSEQVSLVLHGKLAGKIKFTLGLIYFFSLMYFTIKLFS